MRDHVLCNEESYTAFREDYCAAVERACRKCSGRVNKESHFVLRVTFDPPGISYFTTERGDERSQFKSILHKVPCDGSVDGGCWRFINNLPLFLCSGVTGEVMVHSEFFEIM